MKSAKKPVQYFSSEALENSRHLSAEQTLLLHEQYKQLAYGAANQGSQLISMKIPKDLLEIFKAKSQQEGVRYQTQIKNLMRNWVLSKN